LAHIEQQLFRPVRAVAPSADGAGILCLKAPGMVGEARMVARAIKLLLLDGVSADDILVTMRDVLPYADLLREVLGEYGIPVDIEGTEPLLRNSAVAALLRGIRLPEDDWPFAAVTALLRSNYFRPAWIEASTDIAQHAETLLRLLGEPRGRDAYLRAVETWAEKPLPGLEDEQAEESRRRRIHDLAGKCRPFLQRFFRSWDDAPQRAALADHVIWLRRFAEELGPAAVANEVPRDRLALERFWDELDRWVRLEALLPDGGQARDRAQFFRALSALAAEAGLARTPRGPGRVRIISAELARHVSVPHLFVLGLGERSFPNLAAKEPLFDEAERQAFNQAGLDLPCLADRLPDEMLLFYQVVTRARQQLVLSYPAVDDKGQELLPSSFLHTLLECFEPNTVPVESRSMLVDRYDRDMPLSPAEHRVQAAIRGQTSLLSPDLAGNLTAAARMAQHRLADKDFTPYDGLLRHPAVIAQLDELCGAEKVFSPTALETYISCPFRFFLQHVLRLEPVEDPREEIEQTRRGSAFHRALARLHRQLDAAGIQQPAPAVSEHLRQQLEDAVEEYVARAPSPASKELWRLEGQRLRRAAARYESHWHRFVAPWRELEVSPRPLLFEAEFGGNGIDPLSICVDDVQVQIGGRIDRIDVAELSEGLGFWIIDYKTGSGQHSMAVELREFRRLQLTLYALAVERVLLADKPSRPLGLAYWMVTDTGHKPALPPKRVTSWLEQAGEWLRVREELERWVATLVRHIRAGTFPLKPRSDTCTETCDFAQVCRISQARPVVAEKTWHLPLPITTPWMG
jgi:ATP-dependent helicase/DNAse subunit B